MTSTVSLLPLWWVRATGTTRADPHPLDAYVSAIRNRSDDGFRAVYEATVDDLVSFAYGMLNDRKTAEDVVQQAFVELVKAAPRFRGNGRALRSWLFRSVRYRCLDEYRRRKRRPEVPHEVIPESGVEQDPLEEHLDPDLERALRSLSKRHRTAVLLRHVAGLSGAEIAKVMGVTRKAAYSLVGRAEEKLREELGEPG